jgi:hypothetical protein
MPSGFSGAEGRFAGEAPAPDGIQEKQAACRAEARIGHSPADRATARIQRRVRMAG